MLFLQKIVKSGVSLVYRHVRRCFVPDACELIHNLPEVYYNKEVASGIREMSLIRHAHVYRFAEDKETLPFWFRREHAFPERYLYRIADAEVIAPFGGIRFCGKWVQESFGNYGEVLWIIARFRGGQFLRLLRRRKRLVYSDGLYTCVKIIGYYHFLLCSLPEFLHVLKRYPNVKVLQCQDGQYPFVGEFLDLLKMGERVLLPSWSSAFVGDFAFSAVEPHSGFVPPDDIRLLRETFLPLAKETGGGRPCPRIFLSRKKGTRSFSNQAELEALMGFLGYDVVCLEDKPVLQQIELFRSAKVVVANHGAGLSNLIWGNANAKVLELFSPSFFNDCYFRLARTLGMTYRHLIADGTGWGGVDLSKVEEIVRCFDCDE